jgi:hypothetical protein
VSAALRYGLTLLVLLNLVFVHVTGAVGPAWLVPFYLATLLSPALVPLHRHMVYRLVWNVGVLAIFATLVHDAATSGPTHLLEDGLILAAFCQVHLLNVLQSQQKPDLLFFNSFLIALVTSFFCQDLVYSAVFVAYATVFVVTLQLGAFGRDPELPVSACIRSGIARSAVLLVATAAVFALWPRDFRREGLVADRMLWRQVAQAEVDFTEQVVLGRSALTTLSDRIVMTIDIVRGAREQVPGLWRGATLESFGTFGWRADEREAVAHARALDPEWHTEQPGRWTRPERDTASSMVTVRFDASDPRRLFAPLEASALTLVPPADPDNVTLLADGTFRYRGLNLRDSGGPVLTWRVSFDPARHQRNADSMPRDHQLHRHRHLNLASVPAEAWDRLDEATRDLPRDAAEAVVVERCREFLATRFDYLLPGQQGAARDLGEFLRGSSGGHCEYFATALAVMLRLRRIPCRMVTGYLAQEWDEVRRSIVVRARHAHAWVEVWDPLWGWYPVDPTPVAAAANADDSLLADWRAALEGWWRGITRFDDGARERTLAWLVAAPGAAVRLVAARPGTALCLLALLVGIVLGVRRLLGARRDPAVLRYERALRRARIRREPHETPRELLARAQRILPAERMAPLEAATEDHERARFGRAAVATTGSP